MVNESNYKYRPKSSCSRRPIYVMEHLSPSLKSLHAATRIKAKEKGYKYVWIKSGRIYVRKTDSSEHKCVKNIESLNSLN